jgi:hypothetical protein
MSVGSYYLGILTLNEAILIEIIGPMHKNTRRKGFFKDTPSEKQ